MHGCKLAIKGNGRQTTIGTINIPSSSKAGANHTVKCRYKYMKYEKVA